MCAGYGSAMYSVRQTVHNSRESSTTMHSTIKWLIMKILLDRMPVVGSSSPTHALLRIWLIKASSLQRCRAFPARIHCATVSGICRNPNQISSCITPASLLLIEISTVCTNFRYQFDNDHSLASSSTVQTHALTKVYQRPRCSSSRSASACLSRSVLSGLLR